MQAVLKNINRIEGVRGSLVFGADGLVIAANLAGNDNPDTLGAVAGSIAHSLTSASNRLAQGQMKQFVMNGSKGAVVLNFVGSALLLTLVKKDANMGMVLVELKDFAAAIGKLLGG